MTAESGSSLMLHTINAQHIATVETEERILSLTYSTASEGRSVNVIAAGLSNGVVAIWSSWDLSPVRRLCSDTFTKPVIRYIYCSSSLLCHMNIERFKVHFQWAIRSIYVSWNTAAYIQ